MAALAISRWCSPPRSEQHVCSHGFMCHFAAERREAVEVIARVPPRLGPQRYIEITGTVELQLREQEGLAALHGKWISPRRGTMQDQRADVGELAQDGGVLRLVVVEKGARVGGRAAVSDEIRDHVCPRSALQRQVSRHVLRRRI